MSAEDAKAHLDEALRLLTGEVWRVAMTGEQTKVDGICTMVIELERIGGQLGPRGQSMFAGIARDLQAAYVEITAARKALG